MADTSALTIRGPTGAEAQPKLLLQVSMTRHETCTVCSDDITIPVYLPRAISDELDRCGMSFQGTIGCIAIYDQQSNGLLQAVNNMTCFTPQMAKIAAHHLALFDLNEQEVTLILLCAEHDLFINKVLFKKIQL